MALVTVPYNGPLRRVARFFGGITGLLKRQGLIRRFFGKPPLSGTSWREARAGTNRRWAAEFRYTGSGWTFYEYHFTRSQMKELLEAAGFSVVHEAVTQPEAGVYNTIGSLAGSYDHRTGKVTLNRFGRFLLRLLGKNSVGHMLCFIVTKILVSGFKETDS